MQKHCFCGAYLSHSFLLVTLVATKNKMTPMADCYHAKDVIVYCMVSNGKPPRSEMPDAYRYGALLS